MSTPITPLAVVLALLDHVRNAGLNAQRSAEQMLEEVRRNITSLNEQILKANADYEKVETEAFELLKRGGWLGMERHLTGPQVRSVLQIANTSGESAAHDALGRYFSANDCALLEAMTEEWLVIPYLRDREAIIRDAMSAHRARHYTLTVPSLLPFAEGLSAEIIRNPAGQNVVKAVAREWRSREQEPWTELYLDVVLHVIYKSYDFATDPAPYLNRHGILHGRVPDYASALNSMRVFLLIDCVANLWREKQKPTP